MIWYNILILSSFSLTNVGTKLQTTSFGCTCGKLVDPNIEHKNWLKLIKETKREYETVGIRIGRGEIIEDPHPWFVFIEFKERGSSRSYHCGGTLLNQKWALTAAHCFCNNKNAKYKCKWSKKNRRLEPKYNVQEYATLYFGINVAQVSQVANKRFRGVRRVIIHEGFKLADENSYNDLALLKFDRTLHQKDWNWIPWTNNAIYPLCLPDSSYDEVGKISSVTGFGLETQDTCRTNGNGPEIYTKCAPGSIMTHKGKTEKVYGCEKGYAPTKLDPPCYAYNYQNKHNNPNIDEVVLVPKNRSIAPRACYHTKAESLNGRHQGWCGTCIQNAKKNTPGYCGPGAGESDASFVEVTSDSGWGYCYPGCLESVEQSSINKVSIFNQNILSSFECKKLLKSIKSNNTHHSRKQICAGRKIPLEHIPFYEYEGSGRTTKFKKIDPITGYKSPRIHFVPGLDFMIRGEDSCQVVSGGPIWTTEGKVEGDEMGYLVGVVPGGTGFGDCANLNNPAFSTKIKYYLKWIKKHASDGKCTSTTLQRTGKKPKPKPILRASKRKSTKPKPKHRKGKRKRKWPKKSSKKKSKKETRTRKQPTKGKGRKRRYKGKKAQS